MKTLLALVFVLCSLLLRAQQVSIITPSISKYGYPWTVLAGSDRTAFVMPVAETDTITAWNGAPDGTGNNVVTFTADNHLSKGDVILIRDMTSAGQRFSFQKWQVDSATAKQFAIRDGTVGRGVETAAHLQKIEGKNFTGKGTWEIVPTANPTDGSPAETYRLYLQDGSADSGFQTHPILKGVVSHLGFTVGPMPGACYETGSIHTGDRKQHSKIEFDLKFTSSDDQTQVAVMHYDVCANGGGYPYRGVAHVSPGYRQIFKNRYVPLAGQVFGNTNQMMDWTITSAPSGGDATLQYATFPQPVFFSGTVSGQYEITGCPHVDHSAGACDKLAIWVSPNNPPLANADKVEQIPCDVDTTANPTVMDIGPSQTYPDLLSIPQSYAAPLLVRLHNEGPAGHPSEYHNQVQVNLPNSGTWDDRHPAFVLCGVPNPTTGELPIIDGANAKANSWTSGYVLAPYALLSVTGIRSGPSVNDGKVKPFHHVTIAGIHIRNVTTGYTYTDHAGTPGTWGGSMGIRPYGIQYWSVIGTYAEKVATPYFDDCNGQSGWDACSMDTFYEGNHAIGYGIAHQSTEHMFYLQAFRDTVLLNLQDGVVPAGEGTSAYSDRGTRSFHMYNRLVPQPGYNTASGPGGHSEIQDAYNYVLPDEFVGYQGAKDCGTTYSTAPDCAGSFGGWDWFAAMTEEHSNSEFTIGNAYLSTSPGAKFLGVATTHNTTGLDNASQGFYAFNTFAVGPDALKGGQFFFEDTRLGARDNPTEQIFPSQWPRAFIQDNIIPWKDNRKCAYTCATFGLFGHTLMSFQTNVLAPGQVTVAPNIQPTGWQAGGVFQNGINTSYQIDGWSLRPINQNLGGFIPANFIPYNVYPVDANLVPYANSNAIGAATPLTGQLAYYPPRFNAVDKDMGPFRLRMDLTTAGAYDPGTTSSAKHP